MNFVDLMETFDIKLPPKLAEITGIPIEYISGLYWGKTLHTLHELKNDANIRRIADVLGCRPSLLVESYFETKFGGYVYLMETRDIYKIGRSNDPNARHKTLRLDYPSLVLVHSIFSNIASRFERQIHDRYAEFRLVGEWFHLPLSEVNVLKTVKNYRFKIPFPD